MQFYCKPEQGCAAVQGCTHTSAAILFFLMVKIRPPAAIFLFQKIKKLPWASILPTHFGAECCSSLLENTGHLQLVNTLKMTKFWTVYSGVCHWLLAWGIDALKKISHCENKQYDFYAIFVL